MDNKYYVEVDCVGQQNKSKFERILIKDDKKQSNMQIQSQKLA